MPNLRPNVAFILQNPEGQILLCERSDRAGCWQFPQGGVKRHETVAEALAREVEEELGLKPAQYRVLADKGPYAYLFTDGYRKKDYDGQEQHYFLAELLSPEAEIRLDNAKEFQAVRWMAPSEYQLAWITPMKRDVYRNVFRDFFRIELSENIL